MDEEKSPTKAEILHKIAGQVALTINRAAIPETMKVMDQGSAVIVLKVLLRVGWWQALDILPIKKAETDMT